MQVISQWWPYLLLALLMGTAFGFWLRRAGGDLGAEAMGGAAGEGTTAEVDGLRQRLSGFEAEHDESVQRAARVEAELTGVREERDRLEETLARRIGELETQLRERDDRLAQLTEAAHPAEPARAAFTSEPTITRAEIDSLFAEIIEARKAMQAVEQEARVREEQVAAELAEAYAELQAAGQAIRGREERLNRELAQTQEELEQVSGRLAAAHIAEQTLATELRDLRGELAESLAAEIAARKQAQELLAENARLSASFRELDTRLESAVQLEQTLRAELELLGNVEGEHRREIESISAELEQARRALAAAQTRENEQQAELTGLLARLADASARIDAKARNDQRLSDELAESRRLGAAAAEREVSLNAELNRLRHRLETLEKSATAPAPVEPRPPREAPGPAIASVHRLGVSATEARNARGEQNETVESSAAAGTPSTATLTADELERLVLAAGDGRPPMRGELANGQQADDLKAIGGIGPVNERWLHRNGIYFFAQIAQWSAEELAWVARHLPNFGKRVYRENWVRQATELAQTGVMEGRRKRLRADRH
jgi:predicted flap endonuclease-1-like 5' DNA nuclease/predicted  nucleic acid-binding Zn-ribbon protein